MTPFYVESCCWHADGWECATEFSVQDATKVTRAEACARFARDVGELWIDVGVWKRYIRPLDRQELYEWWVERNDWRDDESGGGWDAHPDLAPDDWTPPEWDEEMPSWQFCAANHPDAHPAWICGLRADGPPQGAPKLTPTGGGTR